MTPARDVDASFFLEASAGTGKTTQLIDQIVRCVGAGTKLEGVVAVTFTHAAAGEMKLRLREELGKAGESSADLELAFVGTIHAFCARLLRERPVEAGVDPRFVELDQEAAAKLFAAVFRRWVERRLSAPNPVLRRALTRLTWRDDGEGRDPWRPCAMRRGRSLSGAIIPPPGRVHRSTGRPLLIRSSPARVK